MADYYLDLKDLSVGYQGKALIHDINIGINKGEIVTLIGPNGAGKSTILKSITRQLALVGGYVYFDNSSIHNMSYKTLSTRMAVVLTQRMQPELMLYHEGDNRYATMLDKVADRNLALIKMSPDAEEVLGIDLFRDAVDDTYSFFGEVVWIPQDPVSKENGFSENCPLCHGSGNLTTLMGEIPDTRRCMDWKE